MQTSAGLRSASISECLWHSLGPSDSCTHYYYYYYYYYFYYYYYYYYFYYYYYYYYYYPICKLPPELEMNRKDKEQRRTH